MNFRRTWTWGNWCSRCAICPRLAGSPSPWSKQEISKLWTSRELQVGSENTVDRGRQQTPSQQSQGDHKHVSFGRSIREGVPDVWRPQAEEEKDVNKAEHSEPRVQRGHCVWRSSREHWPNQPPHRRYGLRSVSIWAVLFLAAFLLKYWFPWVIFWTSGLDTMRWSECAGSETKLRAWDGTTGVRCWHTHANR